MDTSVILNFTAGNRYSKRKRKRKHEAQLVTVNSMKINRQLSSFPIIVTCHDNVFLNDFCNYSTQK